MAKKITKIDKLALATIRTDLQAALEAVCKKHGLVAPRGMNISYTDTTFKTTLTFGLETSDTGAPMVDPKLHNNMFKHGHKVGFSVSDIGKSVLFHDIGQTKIVGMCGYTKIAVQADDGKIYRADPTDVRLRLARAAVK
jgi:hypothetical protein